MKLNVLESFIFILKQKAGKSPPHLIFSIKKAVRKLILMY